MRYFPHSPQEIEQMLQTSGATSLNDLFETIPETLRLKRPLDLPPPLSEIDLRRHLRDLSRENAHGEDWISFLGAGAYSHTIPSAVAPLLQRGEFLTAYTPYQPEVSQGTLQALFEYQTMVAEILGMEIANASHYDGSTAMAEAVLMAVRQTGRSKVLVGRSLHPQYRQVLRTYTRNLPIQLQEIPFTEAGTLDRAAVQRYLGEETACLVAAVPNFFGLVEDLGDLAQRVHEAGGLLITSTTEPLAFGLFRPPGEYATDIATAEGQSFGIPMSLGGPGLGLFAARREFVRSIPGRLVGETVDETGKRGFVLTLATREQHIRRERATSNICTNVSLCALAATITLSLLGKRGLEKLASLNYHRAAVARERLSQIPGVQPLFRGTSFNEFVVTLPRDPQSVCAALRQESIFAGIPLEPWYPELENGLLLCVTEMNSEAEIELLAENLAKTL